MLLVRSPVAPDRTSAAVHACSGRSSSARCDRRLRPGRRRRSGRRGGGSHRSGASREVGCRGPTAAEPAPIRRDRSCAPTRSFPGAWGTTGLCGIRAGRTRISSANSAGHGTIRPAPDSPWSVLVPCWARPLWAVRRTWNTRPSKSSRLSARTSPRRIPVSVNVRSIGSYEPPARAKACICSNVNTRTGRGRLETRGSFARTATPLNGFTSATSSVIASSVMTDRARMMWVAPSAERPCSVSSTSIRAKAWRRRKSV